MPLKLYYNELSPPSRAVLLTGKAVGVTFDLLEVDLQNKEHLTPEFLQV